MCSSNQNVETLRVTVPSAVSDRIELALEQLAESSSSWQSVASDNVVYEAYFETVEDAARAANALTIQLMDWTGGMTGWNVTQEPLPAKDWSNAWKEFFHVDRVSRRIVTKPTWEPYTPQPGDCVIELDPGMSFGTGQHETTRGCLRFLDSLTAAAGANTMSFLDLGCGSGILSIAAAKLGCRPVRAIDIDEDAVRIARENIEANGCGRIISSATGDVAQLAAPPMFDIVAANILAPVLIEHAAVIGTAVADGGHLLLAGILTSQFPDVRAAYLAIGFNECEIVVEGEWTCGRFQKPPRAGSVPAAARSEAPGIRSARPLAPAGSVPEFFREPPAGSAPANWNLPNRWASVLASRCVASRYACSSVCCLGGLTNASEMCDYSRVRFGRGILPRRRRWGVGWGVRSAHGGRRSSSTYKTPRDASRQAPRCGGVQEPNKAAIWPGVTPMESHLIKPPPAGTPFVAGSMPKGRLANALGIRALFGSCGSEDATHRQSLDSGKDWIFLATLSGCGRIDAEGIEHHVESGAVLAVPPGSRFQECTIGDKPWSWICLRLELRSVSPLLSRLRRSFSQVCPGSDCVHLMSDVVLDLHARRTDVDSTLIGRLVLLLGLIEEAVGQGERRALSAAITRACDCMRDNMGHAWKIADLARWCGMSASSFAHRFRAETGTTPKQWLLEERMRAARARLADREDIEAVADALGFSSRFHFSREFSRFEGMPPGRFQQLALRRAMPSRPHPKRVSDGGVQGSEFRVQG